MKLLLITSRFPYPLEKGDKLRIYHQLRLLSQNHDIILFTLNDSPVAPQHYAEVEKYCKRIYLFRISLPGIIWSIMRAVFQSIPFQTAYFFRPSLKDKLQKIIEKEQPDHIYCQLIRMAEYVKGIKIPNTLDYMDAFSKGMHRRATLESGIRKKIFEWESKRVTLYESSVFNKFDHHTIISLPDRDAIQVSDTTQIHIVPNGVDTTFFTPYHSSSLEKHHLLFVGNMQYFPNVTAAKYLINHIMPIVWSTYPEMTVMLAGAEPDPEIQKFNSIPNVSVTGWIEDIRDAYQVGEIFVAPLFSGSGQQNKILEAMSMEKPVITSLLVNRAIGGESGKEILLAEESQTFAHHIFELIAHPELSKEIGRNARKFVEKKYSWDFSTNMLEKILTG